jgi:hypothetical protein
MLRLGPTAVRARFRPKVDPIEPSMQIERRAGPILELGCR